MIARLALGLLLGGSPAPRPKEKPVCDVKPRAATLTGTARDAKAGAVLQPDEGAVVYIEGLDSWPAALRDQRVEATGTLVEKKSIPDPVDAQGLVSQGAWGSQCVLTGATWRRLP
jgi:hypothetical protein